MYFKEILTERGVIINLIVYVDEYLQQIINNLYLTKELALAFSGILIGLIIPVAFFLIENIESTDFEFDRAVILTKVINLKNLALSIALLTIPIFLYSLWFPIKFFLLALYFVGFIMFANQIVSAIRWMDIKQTGKFDVNTSYRNSKRYSYLKSLKNYEEQLNVWGYLFESGIFNTSLDEIETLKIFFNSAKNAYQETPSKRGLLIIFHQFYLKNRKFHDYKKIDIFDLYNEDVFKTVLLETIMQIDINKAKERSQLVQIFPQGYDPDKDLLLKIDWSRSWKDIAHIKQQDTAWSDFPKEQQHDPYYSIFGFLLEESKKNIDLEKLFNTIIEENSNSVDLQYIVGGINNQIKDYSK